MVADPRLNTHTGRICNHMNVDHVHTVLAMARMEWPAARRASLTEVTETGVAIVAARGGERRELAIAFKPPAKDMMEARSRLTALHRAAKGSRSLVAGLFVATYCPAVGPLAGPPAARAPAGGEANVWLLARAMAAARALLSAATFHFTYNVLRLHKDGIIGWRVVTIPLGMAAFKKLAASSRTPRTSASRPTRT
ncbi:hypothetical protein SO694_00160048 [Aureococcus anophagefferens]|uniref:DUF2470 domain-containing protein n=1 Tax=Aureococcus anophagefferens TaxID=44056 RepID=A0ABR1G6J0_AURAN